MQGFSVFFLFLFFLKAKKAVVACWMGPHLIHPRVRCFTNSGLLLLQKKIQILVAPISILLNLDQALARDRATSRAIPGRRIGRADGLDLAFLGHFVKKSSNLGHFAKKKLDILQKSP